MHDTAAQAGIDASLVVRAGSAKSQCTRATIRVQVRDENMVAIVPVSCSGLEGSRFLLCTKAYDAARAVKALPGRPSVTALCNGLLAVAESFPLRRRIFRATTTHGCYENSPWNVVHAGVGKVWVDKDCDVFDELLVAGLDPVQLEHRAMTDRLWLKLAANAALNPLTALHACRNGDVLTIARDDICQVCREVAALRARLERRGDDESQFRRDMEAAVMECVAENADNFSSMYQDVQSGRRTEIDALNGWIAAVAADVGVPVPTNSRLAAAVRSQLTTATHTT